MKRLLLISPAVVAAVTAAAGSVTVYWAPVAGLDRYRIETAARPEGPWRRAADVQSSNPWQLPMLAHSLTGLRAGRPVCVRVRSVIDGNASKPSGVACVAKPRIALDFGTLTEVVP